MLLTKQALKASLVPFLLQSSSSSSPRVCGVLLQTRHFSLQSSSSSPKPNPFPSTSSPLIDEPVDKIHKHMAKFTRGFLNTDKVDAYTAKLIAVGKEVDNERGNTSVASKPPVKPALFVGHIVEFAHRGGFEIGYVASASASSLSVAMVDNTKLSISPDQVAYVWPQDVGNVTPETLKSLSEELPSFLETQPIKKRDLTDAWKKLCLFTKVPYTSVLLSKIMFNSTSAISVYATFKMVSTSPYFKRWDNTTTGYKMYNAEGLKGTSLYNFVKKVQQKLNGVESGSALLPNWDQKIDTFLKEDIVEFARNGFSAPSKCVATAKFVLQRTGKEITPESAKQFLTEIGVPLVAEGEMKNVVTPQAKDQADKITSYVRSTKGKFSKLSFSEDFEFRDIDHAIRQDLTHHHVAVVDAVETLAADTGISMQVNETGDKATIYLHVADPTRWLNPSDPISDCAYNATSSLYLPSGASHMLPVNFLGSASLNEKRENYALTVELEVNPDNGQLTDSKVYPSIIGSVARTSFKNADTLLKGDAIDPKQLSKSSQVHITSLLQNLDMLMDARMASAPYQMPTTSLFKPDANSSVGFSVSEIAHSKASPALHYVTVLVDEAISIFAETNEIPLPSPTNFTRPLRSYAGMVTHWQIKAAIREAPLPFNNAHMESVRAWVWRKTTSNNAVVSKMRDDVGQQALRTFYNSQRDVVGTDNVHVIGEVTKANAAELTIAISVREFHYKSVIKLTEENFNKVQVGGTVVLRLRERPTHIGMAFVSAVQRKPVVDEEPVMITPTRNSKSHSKNDIPLVSFNTSPSMRRNGGALNFAITSTLSKSITTNTFARAFSTTAPRFADPKPIRTEVPSGYRIAKAQRGVTSDDFNGHSDAYFYVPDFDQEPDIPYVPRATPPKPATPPTPRSTILKPIEGGEDGKTHEVVSVREEDKAAKEAKAAAKAAAKEAKEAAKAAAKAAKGESTEPKKTRKKAAKVTPDTATSTDTASTPASSDSTPANASSESAKETAEKEKTEEGREEKSAETSTNTATSAIQNTHGGPLGSATSTISTTVGVPVTNDTQTRSFSTLRTFRHYLPLTVAQIPFTSIRMYARGPSKNVVEGEVVPPKKQPAPPIVDDEDDDEDDDNAMVNDEEDDDYEEDDEEDDEEDEEDDEKDEKDEKDDEKDDEEDDDDDGEDKDEDDEIDFEEDDEDGDEDYDEGDDDDDDDRHRKFDVEPKTRSGKSLAEEAAPLAAAAGVGALAAGTAAAAGRVAPAHATRAASAASRAPPPPPPKKPAPTPRGKKNDTPAPPTPVAKKAAATKATQATTAPPKPTPTPRAKPVAAAPAKKGGKKE